MFGEKSVVMYSGYPTGQPGGAMTSSFTRSRLYLFPLTSKTQLTLAVVVCVLSPIGYGFVQPAIKYLSSATNRANSSKFHLGGKERKLHYGRLHKPLGHPALGQRIIG